MTTTYLLVTYLPLWMSLRQSRRCGCDWEIGLTHFVSLWMNAVAPFTLDVRDAILYSVFRDRQSVLDLVHIIVSIVLLGKFGGITFSLLMLVPRRA